MWPFSKRPVEKSAALAAAAKARAKGNLRRAIAEYRRALEVSPDDPAIHSQLAPLLTKAGDYPRAWESFLAAGESFVQKGFVDRAIAVYAHAALDMPWHPETWKAVARLQLGKGRRADAFKALVEGRAHLKRRSQRSEAIELLRLAREIEADDFDATFDLARLLRLERRSEEAWSLLSPLVEGRANPSLRRVRGELFRLRPSARTGWHWVRAALLGR